MLSFQSTLSKKYWRHYSCPQWAKPGILYVEQCVCIDYISMYISIQLYDIQHNTMQMCSITISTESCFLDTLASHLLCLQMRTCGCRQQQCGIMVQSKRPGSSKTNSSTNHMNQVCLSSLPLLWEPFPQGVCAVCKSEWIQMF